MKNFITSLLLALVVPLVFNLCFFTLVEEPRPVHWICYGAVHLAYVALAVAWCSTPRARGGVVFGYAKIFTAGVYFAATLLVALRFMIPVGELPQLPDALRFLSSSGGWPQLVLTVLKFTAVDPVTPKLTLTVFAVLTGVFLIVYLLLMKSEEHSIASDRADRQRLDFVRDCAERLRLTISGVTDFKTRKELERVYDAVRGAQGFSSPLVTGVEAEISEKIDTLGGLVEVGQETERAALVAALLALVRRRDSLIRQSR